MINISLDFNRDTKYSIQEGLPLPDSNVKAFVKTGGFYPAIFKDGVFQAISLVNTETELNKVEHRELIGVTHWAYDYPNYQDWLDFVLRLLIYNIDSEELSSYELQIAGLKYLTQEAKDSYSRLSS